MLAHRVRTSLAIAAAGGALVAALLVTPQRAAPPPSREDADDGMRLSLRATSQRLLAGEAHLAVTIEAPRSSAAVRPPLSLAIVLDRSSSMSGAPLAHAKAAATQLVRDLAPTDAFTIVTYGETGQTLVEPTRASAEAKTTAIAALATVAAIPGTCISCGLDGAAAALARTPVTDGLRRIVLISDGQANVGLGRQAHTRDELVAHAASLARQGVSITAVGVGLDFDERTMTRVAHVGRGNYHFIEDTRDLPGMFAHELAGLARTVAADVHLAVTPAPGVTIAGAIGYPLTRVGEQILVPVADLRSGDTRKVVLRVVLAPSHRGEIVARAVLGWRRVADGEPRRATATGRARLTRDPADVAATLDRPTVFVVEQAISARVIDEAATVYEQRGAAAATRVLERRRDAVQRLPLDGAARAQLDDAAGQVMRSFAEAPPARALKQGRHQAHALAR